MASGKFKSVLIFLAVFLIMLIYLHYHEMHAQADDKLLRALTASVLETRVLMDEEEWLILLAPLWHSSSTFSTRPGIIILTLLPLLFIFYFLSFCFCLAVDIRIVLLW